MKLEQFKNTKKYEKLIEFSLSGDQEIRCLVRPLFRSFNLHKDVELIYDIIKYLDLKYRERITSSNDINLFMLMQCASPYLQRFKYINDWLTCYTREFWLNMINKKM